MAKVQDQSLKKEQAARRKVLFLKVFEEWGTIRKACEVAGYRGERMTGGMQRILTSRRILMQRGRRLRSR